MALVIDLKPNEKLIIGSSIVTNDDQRTRLRIEGDAPILREKDTMMVDAATTPAKKLYFTIQEMYLANSDRAMDKFDDYFANLNAIKALAPHISNVLNDISIQVLQGAYYKGLKLVQDLMEFEDGGKTPPADDGQQAEGQFNQMHMEAQLLSQSADQLQNLYDQWDATSVDERNQVIAYNRKLWMVFFDGVNDKGHMKPATANAMGEGFDITANIINLYNFIYKRSAAVIESADKSKLQTLIDVNREAAMALRR